MEPSLLTLLRELELNDVAITAAIEADGTLKPVGGLWEKLGPQIIEMATRGLVRTLVVAKEQTDVPAKYKQPDWTLFKVIDAETIADVVAQLHQHSTAWRAVKAREERECAKFDLLISPAPMATHYRMLPLLREVKRERLPRDPGARDGEEADMHFRGESIRRWEESLREEITTYDRIELNDVFANFPQAVKDASVSVSAIPRFVVLGPPGAGKTTLEKYLAWRAARGELRLLVRTVATASDTQAGRELLPVRVPLRDWETWASDNNNFALPDYLASQYRNEASSPEQWQRWLERGDLLLLCDGLDETKRRPSFVEALRNTLLGYAECPTVLTCRTVSYELHKAVCDGFPVFTIDGLEDDARDEFIRLFPAQNPAQFNAEELLAQLKLNHTMRPLAANPLLLSIICYVVDQQGVRLPATRGELYNKAVDNLLLRRREEPFAASQANEDGASSFAEQTQELPLIRKRRIQERVALTLFASAKEERELTFDQERLLEALEQAIEAEGLSNPAEWANALLVHFTKDSGVLRGEDAQGYFFLHLTLQEFLAAACLARIINKTGWETELSVAGKRVNMRHLVDRKAWDPRWQEVITMLAGQLNEPVKMLEMLADKKMDDYFRYRLGVAAHCLGELNTESLAQIATITDQITSKAYLLWRNHHHQGTDQVVPHLERALRALWLANGKIQGMTLREYLCRHLRVEIKAIEILKGITATPEILSQLLALLRDQERGVREAAARAIGALGEKAATPEFLAQLLVLLRDQRWETRWVAAKTIEVLGEQSATPEIVAQLLVLLRDQRWEVRGATAWAIKALGEQVATPEIVAQLLVLLRDQERGVREAAAKAINVMLTQRQQLALVAPQSWLIHNAKWEVKTVRELSQI